ncbi:MAG: cell division ATPase MinD [archaeon]
MTRYVAILSGKGGVGKTTTAVNLGVALRNANANVVVVDTNLSTPNVALQLGFPPRPTNIHSILRGEVSVEDAVCKHSSGLDVIQAGISLADAGDRTLADFREALAPLAESHDIVLLDCAAGLWGNVRKSVEAADEVLLVTNPELPALVDALKAVKIAEKYKKKVLGIVVTRVTGARHELKDSAITGILRNYPIIAKIPFDENVRRSQYYRKPVVTYKPNSASSRAYKKLAAHFLGEEYTESPVYKLNDYLRYGGLNGNNGGNNNKE